MINEPLVNAACGHKGQFKFKVVLGGCRTGKMNTSLFSSHNNLAFLIIYCYQNIKRHILVGCAWRSRFHVFDFQTKISYSPRVCFEKQRKKAIPAIARAR